MLTAAHRLTPFGCEQTRDQCSQWGCSLRAPLHPSCPPFRFLPRDSAFLKGFSGNKPLLREWQGHGEKGRTRSRLKGMERGEDVDRNSLTVLLTDAAVVRIVSTVGRKYYSELIVGTVHIMNQLLEGAEGAITHSVRPYSVKRRPFNHRLQTFQTNSLSCLLKIPPLLYPVGTNVLLYLPPPVPNEPASQHGTRNNCTGCWTSPVTLQRYFYPCEVFSIISSIWNNRRENGEGREHDVSR